MSGNPIFRTLAVAASAALLVAALAVPATAFDKADCKKGGWEKLTTADGDAFKNQGQCVKYAAQGGTVVQDACTYLNDPALDGTYLSHGPVMLSFVGDETVSIDYDFASGPFEYEVSVLGFTAMGGWDSAAGGTVTRYVQEPAVGSSYWWGSLVTPQWTVDCTH